MYRNTLVGAGRSRLIESSPDPSSGARLCHSSSSSIATSLRHRQHHCVIGMPLDLLEDADEALLLLVRRPLAGHGGHSLLFGRRVLGDLLVRAGEHRLVVA